MAAENGCKLSGIQPEKGVCTLDKCYTHLDKAEEFGVDFRNIADPEEIVKTIVNQVAKFNSEFQLIAFKDLGLEVQIIEIDVSSVEEKSEDTTDEENIIDADG
ncbi:hypothetical protein U3516DRAFT_841573 [Neocallimastix sp. 'constans']